MRFYKIEINVHLSIARIRIRIRIRASELKEAKYHLQSMYSDDDEMTDIKMEIKLTMMMMMPI